MKPSLARQSDGSEGESYYISMTDMMVGVVFIFILLLVFFGLQYHQTTEALTKADDPKTAALLQTVKALVSKTATIEIDYDSKVVCLPTSVLSKEASETATPDRRCFAFSPLTSPTNAPLAASAEDNRAAVTGFVSADLSAARVEAHADPQNGAINFSADELFEPGSDALSAKGAAITADVAQSLAARLPCYGYSPASIKCAPTPKMAAVNVVGNTSFNAFSPEGQRDWDLALRRTVAFYRGLIERQPILGEIRDAPAGAAAGSQPLLRVASAGQSKPSTAASTSEQTLSVTFVMAP